MGGLTLAGKVRLQMENITQAWQGTNIVAIFTEEGPLCPVIPETQGATNHDSLLQERVSCAHNSGSPLLIGIGPAVSGDTSKMGNQET